MGTVPVGINAGQVSVGWCICSVCLRNNLCKVNVDLKEEKASILSVKGQCSWPSVINENTFQNHCLGGLDKVGSFTLHSLME